MIKIAFLDVGYTDPIHESYSINSCRYGGWGKLISYAKEFKDFYVIASPNCFNEITSEENKANLIEINEFQRKWIQLGNPLKNVIPNIDTFDLIIHPHVSNYFNFEGLKARQIAADLGVYQKIEIGHKYVLQYSEEQNSEILNKDAKIFYYQLGVKIEPIFRPAPKEDYLFFCGRCCPLMSSIEISNFCRINKIKGVFAGPIYPNYPFLEIIDNVNTFYLGEITDAYKINCIKQARLCACIIQWSSPFSLFMLESLSNGTPIVALNSSNFVRSLIKENWNGFFAHNNDQLLDAYHKAKNVNPIDCYQSSLRYNHLNMLSSFFDALEQINGS